tara:strand:+ start:5946 stop:6773 length:828 start_codon:yes stop_codon:yes gene_type:complete
MKKRNYFIILGKNGKIGKSLNHALSLKNENVISLSWEVLENLLNSEKKLKSFLKKNYKISQEIYKLIFINCLKEKTTFCSSLKINKKLFNQFKEFNNKVKYIYFSTYEPNKISVTDYRKIKQNMEKIILSNNGIVIRIGYFLLVDDEYFSKGLSCGILTNMNKNKIFVPVTMRSHLIKVLFYIINQEHSEQIIKCYSHNCCINFVLSYPFLRLSKYKYEINKKYLPIPFVTISKILFYVANIFRYFKIKPSLISFLEKPYSLALQQSIICQNELD